MTPEEHLSIFYDFKGGDPEKKEDGTEIKRFRDVCELTMLWIKRGPDIYPGAQDRIMMDIFEDELEEDPTIITANELAVIMEMENAIMVGIYSEDEEKKI